MYVYYYLWNVCFWWCRHVLSQFEIRMRNIVCRFCHKMAGNSLYAPSDFEVKWQLNTYISFIFLMKFPYSIIHQNVFAYVLVACTHVISSHVRIYIEWNEIHKMSKRRTYNMSRYGCTSCTVNEFVMGIFFFFFYLLLASDFFFFLCLRHCTLYGTHANTFANILPCQEERERNGTRW